jgi:hypothetical protein
MPAVAGAGTVGMMSNDDVAPVTGGVGQHCDIPGDRCQISYLHALNWAFPNQKHGTNATPNSRPCVADLSDYERGTDPSPCHTAL